MSLLIILVSKDLNQIRSRLLIQNIFNLKKNLKIIMSKKKLKSSKNPFDNNIIPI